MNIVVIGIVIFLMSVVIIELIRIAYRNTRRPERARVRKRLRKYSYVKSGVGDASGILKKRVLSDVPFIDRLLWHFPGVRSLDRLVVQANASYPIGFYLLLSLLLAALAFIIVRVFIGGILMPAPVAVFIGMLPYLRLRWMKRNRLDKFKRQLPEGLGLIARAMKAGHALTTGMKLAADEFEDPLGPELSDTLDEINFGVSVPDALKGLAERIDCDEIKYFVVAIILQRETGGNLAELMENLAALIQEKFVFQGKVHTLSAEGRLSAVVLIVLPFFVIGALLLISPNYLTPLYTEQAGKVMLGGAAILMLAGIFVLKKMVDIKV